MEKVHSKECIGWLLECVSDFGSFADGVRIFRHASGPQPASFVRKITTNLRYLRLRVHGRMAFPLMDSILTPQDRGF